MFEIGDLFAGFGDITVAFPQGPSQGAATEIVEANPKFPALQPVACADPVLTSPKLAGFSCTDQMSKTGYPETDWGLDTVTFTLTSDGSVAHLYVRAEGH